MVAAIIGVVAVLLPLPLLLLLVLLGVAEIATMFFTSCFSPR